MESFKKRKPDSKRGPRSKHRVTPQERRRRAILTFEPLESRSLLSTITEYPIPTSNSQSQEIVTGPDNAIWFTEFNANQIGRLALGSGGAGSFTEYPVPTTGSGPMGITVGPDGALWFTEQNGQGDRIGRITTAGAITEFHVPTGNSQPTSIVTGPDGRLWFTEQANGKIGAVTTSGVFTEYSTSSSSGPIGITVGSDGALWFTESNTNEIGRITTAGVVTQYPIPTNNSRPYDITAGADGALWFTEYNSGKIGRITTAGVVTEYTLPGASVFPEGIAPGPDGNIWFVENDGGGSGNAVGVITPGGVITLTPTPTYPSRPVGIASGPGNTEVFVENQANQIGVVDVPVPPATVTGRAINATAGIPFTGVVATFADIDSESTAAEYSAVITWGDGQTSPGTITYNAASNQYTVSGTNTYATAGTYALSVAVTDSGGTGTAAGTAAVTASPTQLTAEGTNFPATEGAAFSGVVATFTDAISTDTASDYTVTITWGDGQTSAGTVTYDPVNEVWDVSGSNTYADEGQYFTSVAITALSGATATASSTANVADAALSATGVGIASTEAAPFSGVVATFTDANPVATASDFSSVITWGDGQSSSGTVVYDPVNQVWDVSGAHTYIEEGIYPVSVTIADVGGSTASSTAVAFVADAPLTAAGLPVSATEGAPFSGVVATFTDADPFATVSDYTVTITWGDGQSSPGTVVYDVANHDFTISGSNTYAEEGTYTVSVAIVDLGGATATASSMASVADAPLTARGIAVRATEGAAFSGVVATFTDADLFATASDYTATVTWGDGQSSVGTVSFDPVNQVWDVSGAHTYIDDGTYSVGVTINDIGGASAGATSVASVADAPLTVVGLPVSATEGAPFSGVVATFTDADPFATASDYTPTITWGDGQSSVGSIAYDGANHVWDVSGAHTYVEEGTYPVVVTINDIGGATAGSTTVASVADAPLTAAGTLIRGTEGAAFSGLVATFTDADPFATASDYTATITWGDGQSSVGTVSFDPVNQVWDVSGAHTYVEEGTYPVSVTIDDVGGASASATSAASVADAPLTVVGLPVSATEGAAFSGVVATFTDADPFATASDYTATVTWGDGQSSAGSIAFDPTNQVWDVSGAHIYVEEGTYPVVVTINDIGGATAGSTTVASVADAPLTESGTLIRGTEGAAFSGLVATFTDADPFATVSDYTVTITWGDGQSSPGTVVYDVANHDFTISGSNTYAEEGTYTVSVAIVDLGGATATASSMASVADAPLTARGIAVRATEGAAFSGLVATFTDADPFATASDYTATVTWGDGQSSVGTVSFDPVNQVWDVSGAHTYIDDGTYSVGVTINDIGGATAGATSVASVADAPLTVVGLPVSATEGAPFSGVVATFTDADPFATVSDYSATVTWGDGQSSAGSIAFDPTNQVWDVSGAHTYVEEGTYPVGVTIDDVGGASAGATSVASVADAPLTAAGLPVSATEGAPFSGVVATFTDADPFATVSDYTATVTWGDGQSSAGSIAFDPTNQVWDVSGAHTYIDEGTYPVGVTINDIGGATAGATSVASVADAPLTVVGLPVSATEGAPFSGVVATFTDADPFATVSDYSATVTWGDGQSSAGSIAFDPTNQVWDVSGAHTYVEEGTYPVGVTIDDVGGASAGATSVASVADAPLTAAGLPVSATEGAPFSGVVATFTDADPFATVSDYSATVTWGDGQSSAGSIAFDPTNQVWDVSGAHTYVEEGTYPVGVTIDDVGGASASATSAASVADAPLTVVGLPVSATEGAAFSGVVATFTDADPFATASDYTATITWGDGQSSAGSIAFDPTNQVWDVSGAHTYVEEGTYPVVVTINDIGGATAGSTTVASVADAPLTESGTLIRGTEGAAFSGLVATFTDADPFATVSDYTATITWGDGQSSPGTVVYDVANHDFTISGSNTYAEEGTYTVSVAIVDLGGATATASSMASVADAPLTARGIAVRATEGAAFSGVVATFTDANPDATAADFSATITWGDGQTSQGQVGYDATNRVFTVSGTNTYEQAGTYAVRVIVSDRGGAGAIGGNLAIVADAPVSVLGAAVSAVKGKVFSGPVASFSDADPAAAVADDSATIVWGDGEITRGAIEPDGPDQFTVSGTKTYAQEGVYALFVTLSRDGVIVAMASGLAVVTTGAPVAPVTPVVVTPPAQPKDGAHAPGSSGTTALGPYTSTGAVPPAAPSRPPTAVQAGTGPILALPTEGSTSPPPSPYASSTGAAGPAPKAHGGSKDGSATPNGPGPTSTEASPTVAVSPTAVTAANQVRQAAEAPAAVAVSNAARSVGEPLHAGLLYERLDDMVKGMDGGWLRPETAIAASGLVVSAGFVAWSSQSWYLLASVLTATPLWKQFDPLEVLDLAAKERGKVKARLPVRRRRGRKNPLLPLLGHGPHREGATKSSVRRHSL